MFFRQLSPRANTSDSNFHIALSIAVLLGAFITMMIACNWEKIARYLQERQAGHSTSIPLVGSSTRPSQSHGINRSSRSHHTKSSRHHSTSIGTLSTTKQSSPWPSRDRHAPIRDSKPSGSSGGRSRSMNTSTRTKPSSSPWSSISQASPATQESGSSSSRHRLDSCIFADSRASSQWPPLTHVSPWDSMGYYPSTHSGHRRQESLVVPDFPVSSPWSKLTHVSSNQSSTRQSLPLPASSAISSPWPAVTRAISRESQGNYPSSQPARHKSQPRVIYMSSGSSSPRRQSPTCPNAAPGPSGQHSHALSSVALLSPPPSLPGSGSQGQTTSAAAPNPPSPAGQSFPNAPPSFATSQMSLRSTRTSEDNTHAPPSAHVGTLRPRVALPIDHHGSLVPGNWGAGLYKQPPTRLRKR